MRAVPKLLLLPGMDGTGDLFASFTAVSGPADVVRYPVDEPLGYDQLIERIALPDRPFVLVGESFSGPLAVRLAAARPTGLVALVLVGSFILPPAPAVLRRLVGPWAFHLPPPRWAIRQLLAGPDASGDLVEETRSAITSVQPAVLSHRLQQILAVDVREALTAVRVPVLLIHGTRDRLVRRPIHLDRPVNAAITRLVQLDAPHLILQRRPLEAMAAIRDLLADSRAEGAAADTRSHPH